MGWRRNRLTVVPAVQRSERAMGSPPPEFVHAVPCLPDLRPQSCPSCLDTTPNHDVMPEVRVRVRIRTGALLLWWGCDATLANLKGGALMRRRESSFSPEQFIPQHLARGPKVMDSLREVGSRWLKSCLLYTCHRYCPVLN